SIEEKIERIIFMGGAVRTKGNVTPVATFNVYCDPEAAKIMYDSKVEIVQVGLDVCSKVRISKDNLDLIEESKSRPGRKILDASDFRKKAYVKALQSSNEETGVFFNDVPAVAYALWPNLFTEE